MGLFNEKLIIMDRHTQIIQGQPIATWSQGAEIEGSVSISNMETVRLAEAQGVRATGTLMLDLDAHGRDKYPQVTINTYLEYPNGNTYLRVADIGVVEAGEGAGPINKRQFAVEVAAVLPT